MSRKHRIVPRIPNLPGPIFDASSVEQFLIAYGDDRNPLPETVKVLDEIVTE
jgi:transcription initiation factor TFIID subunit 13